MSNLSPLQSTGGLRFPPHAPSDGTTHQVMLRGCLQAGLLEKAVSVVRCAYHLLLGHDRPQRCDGRGVCRVGVLQEVLDG